MLSFGYFHKLLGAFYLMPDVKAYYGKKTSAGRSVQNSHELCLELLRDEQVWTGLQNEVKIFTQNVVQIIRLQ
jgi:aspartate/methionine/tyrosine aminotransferase